MASGSPAIAEPRRHHYVPRFLMKNFATQRRAGHFQIWAFDKATERSFRTAVENVAVESDFYSLDQSGVRLSLEAAMGMIESDAAAPIAEILERRSLSGLTPSQRSAINLFCALQFVRGTATRAQLTDLISRVTHRARELTSAPSDEVTVTDQDEAKLVAFKLIVEQLAELALHFSSKDLLLFEATEGTEFILGDNPIAMQNERDFGPYGNIGLALPNIEIYLPIGVRYSLAFYCPTILRELRSGVTKARRAAADARVRMTIGSAEVAADAAVKASELEAIGVRLSRMPNARDAGMPLIAEEDHVTRLNSLQVRCAERWLLGRSANFDIARRMIAADESYRSGLRFSLS
ncbi:DUF4238 domain-containing protein [Bosea sp. (in: a-proteobacteria)]|jgi:hypothetical protein|uniref:DUF4238 domain-containing protein n=1 Tax=Bosea sp. (in: a-proteobacteria) TaxID=1871050 RepID=UPI002DDC9719|nr:DUF4238 domain-containing protein [Bosea sp. (in: a-proteobacteria)]HEV2510363.1 DUF4238 domain-containing protein [Bosea sp. (in: a-proteobacteria)]